MKAPPFSYVAPQSLESLTRIVAERADPSEATILAGGQSLMPLLALRRAAPTCLVDINGLADELGQIAEDGDGVRIGAVVRQRAAERDPRVQRQVGLLAEALPLCGRPATRTRGTVGGSLAHADPAAEIPTVALALDAIVTALGPLGERPIPIADFLTGTFQTALAADEVVTAVTFPDLPDRSGTCFLEISRRHSERAVVGVAVAVTLDDGTATNVRIALANVAGTPIRASGAEAALAGQRPDADAVALAASVAAQDVDPPSDLHASATYRRHVVGVLVRRALTTAIDRAGGAA